MMMRRREKKSNKKEDEIYDDNGEEEEGVEDGRMGINNRIVLIIRLDKYNTRHIIVYARY